MCPTGMHGADPVLGLVAHRAIARWPCAGRCCSRDPPAAVAAACRCRHRSSCRCHGRCRRWWTRRRASRRSSRSPDRSRRLDRRRRGRRCNRCLRGSGCAAARAASSWSARRRRSTSECRGPARPRMSPRHGTSGNCSRCRPVCSVGMLAASTVQVSAPGCCRGRCRSRWPRESAARDWPAGPETNPVEILTLPLWQVWQVVTVICV